MLCARWRVQSLASYFSCNVHVTRMNRYFSVILIPHCSAALSVTATGFAGFQSSDFVLDEFSSEFHGWWKSSQLPRFLAPGPCTCTLIAMGLTSQEPNGRPSTETLTEIVKEIDDSNSAFPHFNSSPSSPPCSWRSFVRIIAQDFGRSHYIIPKAGLSLLQEIHRLGYCAKGNVVISLFRFHFIQRSSPDDGRGENIDP